MYAVYTGGGKENQIIWRQLQTETTQDIVKETAKLPELLHKTTAVCHISFETATNRHQVSFLPQWARIF